MEYDEPDYCPACHDGEWSDRDNCWGCDGQGFVCPKCQGLLSIGTAGEDLTYFFCTEGDWVGHP